MSHRRPPGPGSTAAVHLAFRDGGPAYLAHLVEEYGDVVALGESAWLVNDPEGVRHVLQTSGTLFTSIMNIRGGAAAPLRYGAEHLESQGRLVRLLSQWAAQPRLGRLQQQIQQSMTEITDGADPVSLGRRIGLTMTAEACLGQDADAVVGASMRYLDALLPKLNSPWLLPAWLPTPGNIRLARADRILRRRLEHRIARNSNHRDETVAALLDRRSPVEQDAVPTTTWLRKLLMAAQEPPAGAIGWALYHLAAEPQWLARVQEEVGRLDPLATEITDPVRQLPLTTAVTYEALRIHPPTWIIGRRAIAATEIAGYSVPPGHLVYLSPWLMHQREDLHPDPTVFDPGRWLHPERRRQAHRGFFAFSRGPYTCPGRLPSLTFTVSTVAALIRDGYRVETPAVMNADSRRSMLPVGLRIRPPGASRCPVHRADGVEQAAVSSGDAEPN